MNEKKKKQIIGFCCILISAFFTGFGPAITQKAFAYGASVETVLSTRYLLGTALIWLYIYIRKSNVKVGKKNIILLILIGFLGVIAVIALNESYRYLPGAIASILVFSYIFIVNIIDMIIGREKATASRFICLLLATLGLIAVVWTPGEGISFKLIGVFLALFSALFYALNTSTFGAKRFEKISAEVIAGYTLIIPAVVNFARCLLADEPLLPTGVQQWSCMLFLGTGAIFISQILYLTAIKNIGVSDTAITNTMEPVYAYIAGIVIMGDMISLKSTIGGLIILSAIALLNFYNRKHI